MKRQQINHSNNLENLYKTMFEKLVKLAKNRLSRKDNAVDIVQDVFVKALEYSAQYPDKELSPYILTRNTIIACSNDNKNGG